MNATMDEDGIEVSRRSVLAGLGGVGAASAGAGMGTSAFFSDTETFGSNRLVVGEFDLGVAWQSNYFDWSDDEDTGEAEEFFDVTRTGTNVDPDESGIVLSAVDCNNIPNGGQALRVVVTLGDVKPGDFGFTVFKLGFCTENGNPGYLWTNSRMTNVPPSGDSPGSGPNDENDTPESEASDPDESDPFGIEAIDGELARNLFLRPFYGGNANAFQNLFEYLGGEGLDFAHSFFDTFELNVDSAPTLMDFADSLSQGVGMPLTGSPQDGSFGLQASGDGNVLLVSTLDSGGDVFTLDAGNRAALESGNTILFGLAWGLPVDHANEIQTDSVAFDLGFYAEQERHNTGLGSSIGGLELDKSEEIGGSSGHTAASGVSSGTGYAVKVSEASFAGISGPTTLSASDPDTALESGAHVVVGIHAPEFVGTETGIGQAPPRDSLIGFASLPQGGALNAAEVDIGTTAFTGEIDGSEPDNTTLETTLEDESPVNVTATLWHAYRQTRDSSTERPIMGISPGSPVRDVDGSYVQDEDVPVAFEE
jgi:predicted ribosomally synthesized peptide with SipW-like signal peptide